MTVLKENVNILNQLIIGGETIKAMKIFYSDNVEMQENEETPRIGKNVCIEIEKNNLLKVNGVECTLLSQAIDEVNQIVFSEWSFLVTYKDNNKLRLSEVSVQHWLNGQIISEKFYYNNLILS